MQLTVEVTYYALEASDLPSYDAFNASIVRTDYGHKDDDFGFLRTAVELLPFSADSRKCLGARVRVISSSYALLATINSKMALVNVTGNLVDLSAHAFAAPSITTLNINTDQAATVLNNLYLDGTPSGMLPNTSDPNLVFPPQLVVASNVGDVVITKATAPGIDITTGGTVKVSTLGSSMLKVCQGICGDISIKATGSGRISIGQTFGAMNTQISSEAGAIVMANTIVLNGRRMDISSASGKIYLVSFIQASGNDTHVTSGGGDVAITFIMTNQLYVTAQNNAKVSVVEAFMGLNTLRNTFVPAYPASYNYSDPRLDVVSANGAIAILGLGN
ncbi:hypothetical protein EON62_06480, partial [archaeon]